MNAIITRERPDTAGAIGLIDELQKHLEGFYPAESRHGYSVDKLIASGVAFFVLRSNGVPAACGGILLVSDANDADASYGEIKRMYVRPDHRGSGFAKLILGHLADHARMNQISLLRLETGIFQTEAIALYEKLGFKRIPPFGPYTTDPLSLCYEKKIVSVQPPGPQPNPRLPE